MGLVVCPLAFLVGIIGGVVLFAKRRRVV